MATKSEGDILGELFFDNAVLHLEGGHGQRSVTLSEPKCPTSHVHVRGLPCDSLVVKTDSMPNTGNKIFSGAHGECQVADFAIICPEEKIVVFVEMKNSTDSAQHRENQLKGADCVFEYSRWLVKKFWNVSDFLEGCNKRYVSFCHTASIRKRGTRSNFRNGDGKTPETMLKLGFVSTIFFNSIVREI